MKSSKPFEWMKLGRIFDPTKISDRPWLREFAQAPCVLELEDVLRVFFSCRPAADSDGLYVSYSAWVDLEKRNLTKVCGVAHTPILELGAAGTFDEFGTYPVSVIRDDCVVRAYYAGWTRCESVPFNVSIGVAESKDDGRTFQKLANGPVISYSLDEPFILSGPKIRFFKGRWFLFYIAGRKWKLVNGKPEPVYKIRLATSNDGFKWEKLNKDLIESKLELDEAQASPDVIFSDGKYHMFFCYRYSDNFRGKARGYRIGYASSSDLIHWDRDDQKAGINVSDSGWDSEMVSYPHVFQLHGETYMLYLGNSVGKYGFGLAKLRGELS